MGHQCELVSWPQLPSSKKDYYEFETIKIVLILSSTKLIYAFVFILLI
jgi:hypothetical protein